MNLIQEIKNTTETESLNSLQYAILVGWNDAIPICNRSAFGD